MDDLQRDIDRVARDSGFSGVVGVDVAGEIVMAEAYGLARRDLEVPNTVATRFGIASGTKGVTALTVPSLVEEGALDAGVSFRSVHDSSRGVTTTVVSNWTEGAWPLARHLRHSSVGP